MSKKKKVSYYKEKFSDFSVRLPWKYFVAVLEDHGFERVKKKGPHGSQRLFVKGEVRFTADEPHGREAFVDKYSRKRAIAALERSKGEES